MRKILLTLGIVCMLIGVIGVVSTNFNFGSKGTAYVKEWKFTNDELKNLHLVGSSYSIELEVVPSSDDQNSIKITGNASDTVIQQIEEAAITDHTLNLSLREDTRFFSFMDFTGFEKQQIVITMSKQASFDLVTTDMSSSSISLTNLKTKTANIDSSSGSIKITNLQADQAEVSSSSGSIRVDGATASQLTLKSTSGSIKGADITGNTNATASSGSIKIDQLTGDKVNVKTSSGSINIDDLLTKAADIKASSGSVNLAVSKEFGGLYDLSASSGSISAPESKGLTNDLIKVKTSSGSISIREQ